jgi:hypothetical protein
MATTAQGEKLSKTIFLFFYPAVVYFVSRGGGAAKSVRHATTTSRKWKEKIK